MPVIGSRTAPLRVDYVIKRLRHPQCFARYASVHTQGRKGGASITSPGMLDEYFGFVGCPAHVHNTPAELPTSRIYIYILFISALLSPYHGSIVVYMRELNEDGYSAWPAAEKKPGRRLKTGCPQCMRQARASLLHLLYPAMPLVHYRVYEHGALFFLSNEAYGVAVLLVYVNRLLAVRPRLRRLR